MTPPTTVAEEPSLALTGAPTWDALDIPPVKNPKDEQFVTDYMNMAKAFQTRVKEWFRGSPDDPGPLTLAYRAYQKLLDREKEILSQAIVTESDCKRVLSAYRLEVEAAERKERFRLEEIARQDEENRRTNEAAALEHQANTTVDQAEAQEIREEAKALIDAPITPVVHVEPAPKAKGTTYKEKFSGVMLNPAKDKARLIKAVAAQCDARPELLALFDLNDAASKKMAEMVHIHEKEILPGLVCVREINVSGRRK